MFLPPPPPPGGEECVCVLGIDAQNNRILNKKLNQRIKTILSSKQIHFYNILPERCNKGIEPLTIDYIESRFEEFNETYSLLADEKSKYSLVSWLKLRCSYDTAAMFDTYDENQYFNELIQGFPLDKYIDCGAYTGDMIERFVEFTNGNYNKIYAVEPIPGNLKELENLVATKNYKNVEIIKKGTSNHKDIVNFFDGGEGSRIDNKKDDGIAVEIDTIDNILNGDTVSLIKMDIEGSELDSLKGASKTIEKCMPVLTLSAYHKVEDLITLPKFIKQFHNNSKHYEFYLRHHWITVPYDLVLYALPVED